MSNDLCSFQMPAHHVVARCTSCDWKNDDYREASKRANEHVIETGHDVEIEMAFSCIRTTLQESGRAAVEGGFPNRT